METEDRLHLFRQAVKAWGEDAQLLMFCEESAELEVELLHLIRGRISKADRGLAEEIADVELAFEQLKDIIGNYCEVEKWKDYKLNRLKEKLNGEGK